MLLTAAELPPAVPLLSLMSGEEVLNPSVAVNVLPLVVPGVAIEDPAVAAV